MENKEQSPLGSLSSLLPIFLVGALAIIVFQTWFAPEKPKPQPQQTQEQQRAEQETSGLANFQFASLPANDAGRIINIDSKHLYARLSTRGGRVTALYLKEHDEFTLPAQVLAETDDPVAIEQRALEVTRGAGMDFQPHLYYYGPYGEQLANPPLNNAAFKLDGVSRDEKTGVQEVRFSLPLTLNGHRLELIKIFRFLPEENYFRQITAIRNVEKKEFRWGGAANLAPIYFKPFGDLGPLPPPGDNPALYAYGRFYRYNNELQTRLNAAGGGSAGCANPLGCGRVDKAGQYTWQNEFPDSLELLGAKSRYFFAYTEFMNDGVNALNRPDGLAYANQEDPTGKNAFTAIFDSFKLAPAGEQPLDLGSVNRLTVAGGALASAETGNRAPVLAEQKRRADAMIIDNKVYVGLRNDENHQFQKPDLMAAEFGVTGFNEHARTVIYSSSFLAIFSKIRDGIIWVMRWLYVYVGNYGWCIIIIAVAFKLITWPLNQMQAKSMKRMTEVKPELDRINEQFADDPAEKQKRMMELYKKYNINPMKGCLPMLIQMPVFIALYSAFSESVELWRSPFIGWITDLSTPDTIGHLPYLGWSINILPLVMAGSQVLQQRFTTVVADKQQQMIMYMMPVMMLFFFWTIPSGVTLYWTVQNILAIVWQLATNKLSKDEPAPTSR